MKKNDKKAEIICIGVELISLNGYNATGVDAVLKKAGVPKGSFYHYFSSKEDFGLAVIEHFAEHYDEKLDAFLGDTGVSPCSRIRNYLDDGLSHLTENKFTKGCLIGNLGQELADQNERFRSRLETIFKGWTQKFSDCVAEAQQKGELKLSMEPDIIADFILSGWEGAVLRAKVMKSPAPLKNFIQMLFTIVLQ